MKYEFERMFEKDFSKLKNKKLAEAILEIIDNVSEANNIREIKTLKKLKNHSNAYRIRSGNYCIGVFLENDTIVFAAFHHRKDIYKKFP
jgi:mRNA interferase RelE/StbE